MDNRTSLLLFIGLVVLFAFTFIFGLDALTLPNLRYGVIALIGYTICLGFSLFQGMLLSKDRAAMTWWFFAYAIICAIVYVWYLTRCGTAFGWW